MARRRSAVKRERLPDPKFSSVLVTELIGTVLKKGKKTVAEKIVYTALEQMHSKIEGDESIKEKLETCLSNIRPTLEVKSRRVGGSTYQVPIEVPGNRSKALALRWLLEASRNRNEKDMSQRLASELVQAYNNEGNAVRKRVDTHKMADANKAFAHFRW
ncbi:MAG: 30S ribosomal protein S7 [Fibrobacterales bacterium]